MVLTVKDRAGETTWLDEWSIRGRAPFIGSQNLDTLKTELGRYVRGEVDGRSFLIAGHRGSGKTSLVRRAIEDFAEQVVRASTDSDRPERMLAPQRPLIVKLHGPSLLTPPPARGEAPAPDATQWVLMQITIGLYRALAREAADCFAVHAREARRQNAGDQLELAGQLQLELDRAPEPAILRDFWDRLGRLGRGVFWPDGAAWMRDEIGSTAQGVREIVALATAAQAFQVCSGDVSDKQTDNNADAKTDTVALAAGANLARGLNGLIGIAAGGVAGVLLDLASDAGLGPAHTPVALGGGLAVGLVTALTLDWNSNRTAKREKTRDYTFILDRTPQTLERDLPLVIERVRAAGLAPVFVIDELDKLETPEAGIRDLIGRLKHLITDFGFFCFLADRRYYEYVRHAIQTRAFPPEHTYFSGHVFVLYRSQEFKAFLDLILDSDQPLYGPDWQNDDFARKVFVLCVLHRARLNTIDVVREISRERDTAGSLRMPSSDLRSLPANHLAATVQLAIEHLLKSPELKARMEAEPLFAQMAIDALYRLSREWEGEALGYEPGRQSLLRYLARRIAGPDPTEPATAGRERESEVISPEEAKVRGIIGPVDIDLVVKSVEKLEAFMVNFNLLSLELAVDPPAEGAPLIDLIPFYRVGLIEAHEGRYRFRFDAYGQPLEPKEDIDAVADVGRGAIDGLREMADAVGVDPALLIEFDLLPRTIDWSALQTAPAVMTNPTTTPADRNTALGRVQSFMAVLQDGPPDFPRARRIAEVLELLRAIARDAGVSLRQDARRVMQALGRYMDVRALMDGRDQPLYRLFDHAPMATTVAPPRESLPGGDMSRWSRALEESSGDALNAIPVEERADLAWVRWEKTLLALVEGASLPAAVDYDDVVCAAANLAPGRLFRAPISAMSRMDWSEVLFAALPAASDAPTRRMSRVHGSIWVALAALRILGFGGPPLEDLHLIARSSGLASDQNLEDAVLSAGRPSQDAVAGALVITAGDWPDPAFTLAESPVILVPQRRVQMYGPALRLLYESGVITKWSGEA